MTDPLPSSQEYERAELVHATLAADARLAPHLLPCLLNTHNQVEMLEADAAVNADAVLAVEVLPLLPDDGTQGEPAAGRCWARVRVWVFARRELHEQGAEDATHRRLLALQDAVLRALLQEHCNRFDTALQNAAITEVQEVDATDTKLKNTEGRVIVLQFPIYYT